MKGTKKIVSLIVALAIFAGMALGSSSDTGETKPISGGESEATENAAVNEKTTIEQQVLVDRDGLKITAMEFVEDSIWGEGIKVLLENTSQKDLGVNCKAVIVNDYMISDLFSSTIAAGKKANETIHLSSSGLEAAGITNIGKIELYFHVYDSDTYDGIFDADPVTIQTSAFESMDSQAENTGNVLFEKDGIKIVGKYVEEDSFWGTAVLLYIENATDKNLTFSCEDMSINGFMVDPVFYAEVYAGKKAVEEITIFSTDLEENNISAIEELEVKFRVYNTESYDTVVETDPITINVAQ